MKTLGDHDQIGHSREVKSLDYSLDGKLLISTSKDQKLMVWDLQTGQKLIDILAHYDGGRHVAVTNGNKLVSAGFDHIIKLWDWEVLSKEDDSTYRKLDDLPLIWATGHELVVSQAEIIDVENLTFSNRTLLAQKEVYDKSEEELGQMIGRDLQWRGQSGNTLAHEAARLGYPKILKQLEQRGFDFSTINDSEDNALHIAIRNYKPSPRYREVIAFLADQNDLMYKENEVGVNAIYESVKENNLDALKILVAKGADLERSQAGDYTIAYLAAQQGYVDILLFLKSFGG